MKLARREKLSVEEVELADIVRACFLFLASPSVETCPLAERIGYDEYEENVGGTSFRVRGVSVPHAGALLTDIVDGLMEETQVPTTLITSFPGLSQEDYRAALWAIRCILHALQWTSFDIKHEAQYSNEKMERVITKTIEQLQFFRRTGEP